MEEGEASRRLLTLGFPVDSEDADEEDHEQDISTDGVQDALKVALVARNDEVLGLL